MPSPCPSTSSVREARARTGSTWCGRRTMGPTNTSTTPSAPTSPVTLWPHRGARWMTKPAPGTTRSTRPAAPPTTSMPLTLLSIPRATRTLSGTTSTALPRRSAIVRPGTVSGDPKDWDATYRIVARTMMNRGGRPLLPGFDRRQQRRHGVRHVAHEENVGTYYYNYGIRIGWCGPASN